MGKLIDSAGVSVLWNKVKNLIKTKVDEGVVDKLGVAEGIATLDENAKLTEAQLPTLKTINGNSIVGEGNVELDLSLYKIVDSLPTENIDTNKIYLVVDANDIEGNLYDEFIYANNKWEKLGSYRASIELTDYIKTSDILTESEVEALLTDDDEQTPEGNE